MINNQHYQNMFRFEDLKTYQEALKFVDYVYDLVQLWPKNEQFILINQLLRATISIALNIAEGSSRTKKDFRHFLDLSKGSCYECVAVLAIAKNRKYISEVEYKKAYENCLKLAKMLSALKSSIK